ncbi:hypothetical protein B0T26DRAFT_757811 [Lasiosphaeria miniovina]|uniref:Phospholipase n=1 Tax=Lasiosphaeria miniovina TaxID=1954250 RepID=A0AA39ZQH5_9PEZI|nr:uncharacterized protein B0T26DRAFT_757811 [Lasiosphaeria miniovina]KAK0701830.1 hypothetical protein B0T26DRAFT_757811 [Lasiosphaeria miniovina]
MGLRTMFKKMEQNFEEFLAGEKHSHTHLGHGCHEDESHAEYSSNRYCSFAPQSSGHAKWYVDGASYFWAVSMALEEAQESIYILDWWLSPELYLRRPPARNARYRLDNLLKEAAERGVKVNVIVYKEVEKALTLNSIHTKHALEALHPNIKVFRHPDHAPNGNDLVSSFKDISLKPIDLAKASKDALCALYGSSDDMVLFWAHHEKLCLVDRKVAFMGGLDMCFGRYDTNSHPIADAHPGNLDDIIFPGQDYNNARVYDFEDVERWENNKLDRTKSSRMGWSDISISLSGPIVDSLLIHFADRWNYIFKQKYTNRDIGKYGLIESPSGHTGAPNSLLGGGDEFFGGLHHHFSRRMHNIFGGEEGEEGFVEQPRENDGAHIQLTRRQWSSGLSTEHSIANAYISAITNARHYVYIENQFFITATSDEQKPVANKIGRAIVDRIVLAHQNNEDFHVFILMPAVPAFAGDLKDDGALGTRAIMEFQYNSINRGGHSIIETLQQEGVDDPHRYINFYNLRNYDRINTSAAMGEVERQSGVPYEDARRDYDNEYEHGDGYRPNDAPWSEEGEDGQYRRYQEAASQVTDQTWDTIAACYMDAGPDLHGLPWNGTPESELDAFVSEELYIHTKVLIADDQLVICGSANLNDRSQLGNHDSEIAVVIEDPTPIASAMGGQPYTASAFATSLRRQLFRKHLGLLPDQKPDAPNGNWTPVTHEQNTYDWDSPADSLVRDPIAAEFLDLWRGTARRNTDIFSRVFHPVPNDAVRTWDDYDAFFSRHFVLPGEDAGKAQEAYAQGKVDYGHVVREEFPGGVAELKDCLAGVRGNLVDMPLSFLIDVPDIAEEGLELNHLTAELYT